ncbi:hypothetical protein [Dermatobacter hominis]|uniref:hypothetical protein n=1 Tax=Dermatobacter hominis TaxID=2884263 RepID=UPI001D1226CC|nr:hypothetical protein [Dermatobacter hominis]UDY35171.1 hypothetical protein LH044_17750 [Dermatobacter hominis]
MPDDVTPATVDDLYAVDPDGFVAARRELVRRLRAEGDRDGAARAAEARKPPRSAWALNVVARREPDVVADLVGSIGRLRAALDGDGDPRAAMAEHREAIEAVLDAAERTSGISGEAWRSRMRGTLQAAATDDGVAALLSAGALRDDVAPSGLGPLSPDDGGGRVVSLSSRRHRAARAGDADAVEAPSDEGRADEGRADEARSDEGRADEEEAPPATEPARRADRGATAREERRRAERARREAVAAQRRRRQLEKDLRSAEAHAARLAAEADTARRAAEEADEAAEAARSQADAIRAELDDEGDEPNA